MAANETWWPKELEVFNKVASHLGRGQVPFSVRPILLGFLMLTAAGIGHTVDSWSVGDMKAMLLAWGCDIKGNVSISSKERIHHVPGQQHYRETHISLEHVARWFC